MKADPGLSEVVDLPARRRGIAAGVLLSLLGTVSLLLGCHRVPLSAPLGPLPEGTTPTVTGRPPPSATPCTPVGTLPKPTDQPHSSSTATSEAAAGKQPAPEDFSIVFHTSIIYGSYSVLRLSASGRAESVDYNDLNWIYSHRQGDVGADRAAEILYFLDEKGFYELDHEYDIYPLPTDQPEIVYEDWYYAVRVSAARRPDTTVLSHHEALPSGLRAIVDSLNETVFALPERPVEGTHLLAGHYDILRYKRAARREPTLRLNEGELEAYPLLQEALARPYSLIQVETLDGTKLGEVLSPKSQSVEVILGNERFVVFLLTPPQ